MLRTAFNPLLKQGQRKLFWAGAAGASCCLAVAVAKPQAQFAICAPASFSQVVKVNDITTGLTLQNVYDDLSHCRSLVLPTMEAVLRAMRLVSTAVIMAADYQMYVLQRKHSDSFLVEVYSWVFPNNNNICKEKAQKHRLLEEKIEQLEKDLHRVQNEYTKSPSNEKQKYTGSDNILEHTQSKRQQKEEMMDTANQLATAQQELASENLDDNDGSSPASSVHQRNAERLLQLFRTNAGVYIKVGQHLANLDLLLPEEYIQTLASLFDAAPVSSYEDVCQVVNEELGSSPEELFGDFSNEPFASASLAQVHTAICKETGKKLAIKVQHRGLRETSKGDLFAMSSVVSIAEKLFDE